MKLTPEGLQLLLDWEVGGGREYYEKFCIHPTVPDPENTSSGITIGIGYDLGQNDMGTTHREWDEYLPIEDLASLLTCCGLRGAEAVKVLSKVRRIEISWDAALAQFLNYTVPRYNTLAEHAFPFLDVAPQAVQESLLSLVFNRGTSMDGDRRKEMRAIRGLVKIGKWDGISGQLRQMKRLWPNTRGLRDRREAEALHIENAIGRVLYELPEGAEPADQDWTTPGFYKRGGDNA